MSKLCYVIMPYGSSDESRYKKFKSIFSAIIKPAAEAKGYTVIREDHEARQGNIGTNIIKSLAEADLVIADLSENNWNVAYELGIRHVLQKSGTILIKDKNTPMMFDIQGNKIIEYLSEWYDCIDDTQQKIMDAIDYVENNLNSSDSPVHDVYPKFAVKIVDYLTDNNDEEKRQLSNLRIENAKLKEALEDAGLSANNRSQKSDITSVFKDALSRSQYSGTKALNKLQECIEDEDEFVEYLALVMSKGFLSETDCKQVYFMCQKLDNYFVSIAFLEEVVRRYPDNEEFTGRLAREYAKSAENRAKAVMTVNQNIGLRKVNGKYSIEKKAVSHNILAAFFDVYIWLDSYSEMKEIIPLLLEKYPAHSELINRNLVTALNGLNEYSEAEVIARELITNNPSAINHYSYYKVCRLSDRNVEAYEQMEACIRLEPDDSDYYMLMAGLILDEYYIKLQSNYELNIVKVSKQQAIAAAIPFIFAAYQLNHNVADCINMLQRNNLKEATLQLYSFAKNNIMDIPRSDEYNYGPLDLCTMS